MRMSEHKVITTWKRESDDFGIKNYNRHHTWEFKNGETVRASAAVAYLGDADCVDPEEAFVASLSSCHMLTFLAVASMKKYTIDHYEDTAIGYLEKNSDGALAITRVALNPIIEFVGDNIPDANEIEQMHEKAHQQCFIANSVKTKIEVNH